MAPEIKKSIPEIDAKLYNELVTVAEQNGQTKRHVLEQAFRFYSEYLTVAEVYLMHHRPIEMFGGAHGVRDTGAIEAAIFRPQIGYYNSIQEEAAALMESLANCHGFLDGNKRIAFAAADVFLRRNGFYLEVTGQEFRFVSWSE